MSSRIARRGKSVYRVKNWNEYNQSLKNRGKLVFLITEEILNLWYAPSFIKQSGGQYEYSDYTVEIFLSIKKLMRLGLRQTQGFIEGLFHRTGIALRVPDYTVISRRASELDLKVKRYKNKDRASVPRKGVVKVDSTGLKFQGEGEWMKEKHGTRIRHAWRKAHIMIDESGEIISEILTDNSVGDATAVPEMMENINENVDKFFGDGSYDSEPLHDYLNSKYPGIDIITPPSKTAVLSPHATNNPTHRDRYITDIEKDGRYLWELKSGYSKRNNIENTMFRLKSTFGGKLDLRNMKNQKTEFTIECSLLNLMNNLGKPDSYRVTRK